VLLRQAAVVAREIRAQGGYIAVEWPRSCNYWRDMQYQRFAMEFGLLSVYFDGCMFGLVGRRGKAKGIPIRKPWRVDTDSPVLQQCLFRICDGKHVHTPCAGSETKATEGYTDQLVASIHTAFRIQVQIRSQSAQNRRSCELSTVGCAGAGSAALASASALPLDPCSRASGARPCRAMACLVPSLPRSSMLRGAHIDGDLELFRNEDMDRSTREQHLPSDLHRERPLQPLHDGRGDQELALEQGRRHTMQYSTLPTALATGLGDCMLDGSGCRHKVRAPGGMCAAGPIQLGSYTRRRSPIWGGGPGAG